MPTVYNKVVADNTTLIDLSQDTVTQASHIVTGYVGHLADGTQVTGTGGGGGAPVTEKDVNFIDYDGTILYSYTAQEAAALSAMPANPSHTGLTAQGWNYTLAQMKAEVTATGKCTAGQMYTTSDGKTRIYITIPAGTTGAGLTFYVRYTQTVSQGVTVDWGDGNSETFTGTSATNRSHTYSAAGDYVITLNATSGSFSIVGSSSQAIYGSNSTYYNRTRIRKAEFGDNMTSIGNYAIFGCYALESVTIPKTVTSIGNNAFSTCCALKSVTIPKDVTSIGTYVFNYCYALKSISIPSGVTSIGTYAFNYCYALESVTIPQTVTSIGTYTFNTCYTLRSVTIPSGVTSIGAYAFYYCYALESVTIPSGVTSIESYIFYGCCALKSVTIPSGVTSIGSSAFANCYALGEIHFKPSSPPSVGGSNAWSNIPAYCKIFVPTGKLSAYTSASNYPSSTTHTYVEE